MCKLKDLISGLEICKLRSVANCKLKVDLWTRRIHLRAGAIFDCECMCGEWSTKHIHLKWVFVKWNIA